MNKKVIRLIGFTGILVYPIFGLIINLGRH